MSKPVELWNGGGGVEIRGWVYLGDHIERGAILQCSPCSTPEVDVYHLPSVFLTWPSHHFTDEVKDDFNI